MHQQKQNYTSFLTPLELEKGGSGDVTQKLKSGEPITLSETSKFFCKTTGPLPTELKQVIFKYVLPPDHIILKNMDTLVDVLAFVAKLTISFEIRQDLKAQSTFTGSFIVDLNHHSKILEKVPRRDTILEFPSYFQRHTGCLIKSIPYKYNYEFYKNELEEKGLSFEQITCIRAKKFPRALPPQELIRQCVYLRKLEIQIHRRFDDFEGIEQLANSGLEVILDITDPSEAFLNSDNFKKIKNNGKVLVRIKG